MLRVGTGGLDSSFERARQSKSQKACPGEGNWGSRALQRPPAAGAPQNLSGELTGHSLWVASGCGAEDQGGTLKARQSSEATVPWN